MMFVEVQELPKKGSIENGRSGRSTYHKYAKELETFTKMNVKIAKVVFASGEFKDTTSVETILRRAVKTHGFPINIHERRGDIYLVRRDI